MRDAFGLFVQSEAVVKSDWPKFQVALKTAWDAKYGSIYTDMTIEIAKAESYILTETG